ncbi:zinc-binding dehydrogenase, partial [Klebsiella pneumoniae]|nr:zinc-binding dehydrogenase [Klebsiella pneumoniae]
YKAIKESGVRAGEWLVLFGLGGLGNLALQYAKKVFNAKVIAVDINDSQLEFAKQYDADVTLNPKEVDVAKYIQEHVGGAHAAV